jgi:hypothetical protein
VTTRFLSYTVPSLLGFLYSGGISFDPSKTTRSLYDSPKEDSFTCFMAKGPKVKHPEYFDSNEDDLLHEGEDFPSYDQLGNVCEK